MSRAIAWHFIKVTLQKDLPFKERQAELKERLKNADTYVMKRGKAERRYQLYDLEFVTTDDGRELAVGHLTRSPKVAHGLELNERTRRSQEGVKDVPEIADYTEFLYDFRSCVLAYHRRAPFLSPRRVADVWRRLLGEKIKEGPHAGSLDVHAEALRDSKFTDKAFDSKDDLTEVALVYAKPNPGGMDDSLRTVTLGLIGEDTGADQINFAAKKEGGSLDKARDGFIRRSIRSLLEGGYLKSGRAWLGNQMIDLLKAKEKLRETSGYTRTEDDKPKGLKVWAAEWFKQLVRERDIYREP